MVSTAVAVSTAEVSVEAPLVSIAAVDSTAAEASGPFEEDAASEVGALVAFEAMGSVVDAFSAGIRVSTPALDSALASGRIGIHMLMGMDMTRGGGRMGMHIPMVMETPMAMATTMDTATAVDMVIEDAGMTNAQNPMIAIAATIATARITGDLAHLRITNPVATMVHPNPRTQLHPAAPPTAVM